MAAAGHGAFGEGRKLAAAELKREGSRALEKHMGKSIAEVLREWDGEQVARAPTTACGRSTHSAGASAATACGRVCERCRSMCL